MSDAFYANIERTVTGLITRFGRDVQFIRESRTPSDSTKPWNGPGAGQQEVLTLKGVFTNPNTVREFGITSLGLGTEFVDLMEMSQQVIITNSGDNDLRQYRVARDNGIDWNFLAVQQLRPGNVGILSFVLVRR